MVYFLISDLIFYIVDFWTILIYVLFYSIIIPLNLFLNPLQYFLAGISLGIFILSLNLIFRFLLGFFEFLVKLVENVKIKRVYKLNILMIMLFSAMICFLFQNFETQKLLEISSNEFMRYTPVGQMALALINLAQFSSRWILNLFIIFCYTLIFFLSVYLILTIKVNHTSITNHLYSRSKEKNYLKLGNDRIPVLFIKEGIYLIRSTRIKLIMFIGVLFSILYLSGRMFDSNAFSYLNVILLCVGAIYLTFESISSWLHEGPACQFYFYSNLDFKKLILSKNLAFFFWIMVVEVLSIGTGFFIKPIYMTFENITFSVIFLTAFFWLMAIILNYFAFSWPRKVSYDTLFSKSMSASTTAIFMIPTIILFIILYIPFMFNPIISQLLIILIMLLSIFVYQFSLSLIKNHAHHNKEHFIETVS
jgi:hypothetical protein